MIYQSIHTETHSIEVQLSSFLSGTGANEYHAMINISRASVDIEEQINTLRVGIDHLLNNVFNENVSLVWCRYFMSDPANQYEYLPSDTHAVSIVGQAPLNYSKISLWCYFVEEVEIKKSELFTSVKRNSYTHFYYTGLYSLEGREYDQTHHIFDNLRHSLKNEDMSVYDDLIRTWIYVQGVDTHYKGMVEARKELFEEERLTENTHYIASTGIEGRYVYPQSLVFMDAYAIKGLKKGQVSFLYAPEFLSPTSKYGVTFERGSVVEYGDRKHLFISGTASIDKHGEIVYSKDILGQTKRTLLNLEALLKEGGALMDDIAQLIIYLRDTADYPSVREYVENTLPHVPKTFVLAPVCRPGWLIEMECIAVCRSDNDFFPPF